MFKKMISMPPGGDIDSRSMGILLAVLVVVTLLSGGGKTVEYISYTAGVLTGVMSCYLKSVRSLGFWFWSAVIILMHLLIYLVAGVQYFPKHFLAAFPAMIAEFAAFRVAIDHFATSPSDSASG